MSDIKPMPHKEADLCFIPAATFRMGSDHHYPEEAPAHVVAVDGFWMDRYAVTNRDFDRFVQATGHVTLAERPVDPALYPGAQPELLVPSSVVFVKPPSRVDLRNVYNWWQYIPGADWRHPRGPHSSLQGLWSHPVVHVAFEDAAAYAEWAGRRLPSEEQFERAAETSARRNASGEHAANTWQGRFPVQNDPVDGYPGAAPVACYEPNALGLYDMIGNVWEWTASAYYPRHDFAAKAEYPDGFDPNQPGEPVAVLKGGSYLCAPEYCMRYRPQARIGQSRGLGASHVGFRTVLNP